MNVLKASVYGGGLQRSASRKVRVQRGVSSIDGLGLQDTFTTTLLQCGPMQRNVWGTYHPNSFHRTKQGDKCTIVV